MKETKSTLLHFLLTFIHQNKLIRLIYKKTSFILRLNLVLSTRYRVFSTWYLILSTWFLISSCVEWAGNPSTAPPDNPTNNVHLQKTDSFRLRIATFNVSSAEYSDLIKISNALKDYYFDVLCITEVPSSIWSEKLGQLISLDYSYTGEISSGNKKGKLKSILSRYPLQNTREYLLNGKGWKPASIIKADIEKQGAIFSIYNIQICKAGSLKGSYADILANDLIERIYADKLIIAGDFNLTAEDPEFKMILYKDIKTIWTDNRLKSLKATSCCNYETTGIKENIDHILYSGSSNAKIINAGVIESKPALSVHNPVWVEFVYPPVIRKKRK